MTIEVLKGELKNILNACAQLLAHPEIPAGAAATLGRIMRHLAPIHQTYSTDHYDLIKRFGEATNPEDPDYFAVDPTSPKSAEFHARAIALAEELVEVPYFLKDSDFRDMKGAGVSIAALGPLLMEVKQHVMELSK